MFPVYDPALILTVRMDESSQQYFDGLRGSHFPAERNFLKAHLTLFHKLPVTEETVRTVQAMLVAPFSMRVTGLINLGAGVAFRVESDDLNRLRARLADAFSDHLSAQDKQGFRPHVTVSNKIGSEDAKQLLSELSQGFTPFEVKSLGLDLWEYLGGPWEHRAFVAFS